MDERSSKRARQVGGVDTNMSSNNNKLAGCHLDVKVGTGYIFFGQSFDVEVRLLNEEDLVHHTTVAINVSLTGNDKVPYSVFRSFLRLCACTGSSVWTRASTPSDRFSTR